MPTTSWSSPRRNTTARTPALLKNAIDWISRPEPGETHLAVLRGKKAAILSASPGPQWRQRGLRHLRELLEMIGVSRCAQEVTIAKALQAFDPEGRFQRPEDRAALSAVAQALVPAASTLLSTPSEATLQPRAF